MRALRAGACLCLALVVIAASARAQVGPESPQRRIAVLVMAGSEVDREIGDELTEVAIAAVAGLGRGQIVGKEELQARLGQEESSTRECLGSSACIGRLGVELGVDEVVAGTVGPRGGGWVFNLNRIDVRSAQTLGRVFREVEGDLGALARALREAMPELYVERAATSTLVITVPPAAEVFFDGAMTAVGREDGPVRLADVEPGPHEVVVQAPGFMRWRRTVRVEPGAMLQLEVELVPMRVPQDEGLSPLVFVGIGVAVAGLALGTVLGVLSQRDFEQGGTRAEAIDFVDSRESEALGANIAFGVAGAGLVTAGIGLLLSGGDDAPSVSASVDGMSFTLDGTF